MITPAKLILTDIDGTILPWGEKVVSARTRAAFHQAMEAGIAVGPASGRFYSWIPRFFDNDQACCSTAIATNGLQVYHQGQMVLERGLDPQYLRKVQAVLEETPHAGMMIYSNGSPRLVCGELEDLAIAFPAYAKGGMDSIEIPDQAVPKANAFLVGDLDETRRWVDMLSREVPELDFDVPQPMFSNIMPKGWNKGTALAWLRDYLGLSNDEVVVFGDGGNDLPLFENAVNSVAVENAMPEAAKAARWHIGSVQDDAVAACIEALSRGEWPFTR